MFTVMKRIQVDARHAVTFEAEVAAALADLQAVPGSRGGELLRPATVGEPYIVRLDWEDAPHHIRWLKDAHGPIGQAVLRRLLVGGRPPETFEPLGSARA